MNEIKFQTGDLVYYPNISNKIGKIVGTSVIANDPYCLKVTIENTTIFVTKDGKFAVNAPIAVIYHANQENYEWLSATFPNVSFEPPPKPKEPKDVIQAIINSNHKFIACINTSADVEKHPLDGMGVFSTHTLKTIDYEKLIGELVPFDLETGKVIVDFVDGKPVLESGNAN